MHQSFEKQAWPLHICDLSFRKYYVDERNFRFLHRAYTHLTQLTFFLLITKVTVPTPGYTLAPLVPVAFCPSCFDSVLSPPFPPLLQLVPRPSLMWATAHPLMPGLPAFHPHLLLFISHLGNVSFLKCKNLMMPFSLFCCFHGFQLLVD